VHTAGGLVRVVVVVVLVVVVVVVIVVVVVVVVVMVVIISSIMTDVWLCLMWWWSWLIVLPLASFSLRVGLPTMEIWETLSFLPSSPSSPPNGVVRHKK